MLKDFRSKEYSDFNLSRQTHRKSLIRFLRLGISILACVFLVLRIGINQLNYFDKALIPAVFLLNLLFSTAALNKKFERIAVYYLCGILMIAIIFSLEVAIYTDAPGTINIFFGLEAGMLYTLLLLSKLPLKHLLFCSGILYIHGIARIYMRKGSPAILTPILLSALTLILNFSFMTQELLEFRMWQSLQKSHRQLENFQKLIQLFPSKILVFAKRNEHQDLLYMNEEVSNFLVKELADKTLEDYLKSFSLDSLGCSIPQNRPISLFEKLRSSSVFKLQSSQGFETYYGSYKLPQKLQSEQEDAELKSDSILDRNNIVDNNLGSSVKEIIRYEIKIGGVKWGDEDEALIFILNDISKTEMIRDLKLLHENKDKMLATVSHELRTPLNGIIGMIDLAQEKLGDHIIVKKYLRIAKNSARALLLMINDILDISQIEKGTLRLDMKYVRIDSLIKEVLPLIKVQLHQKGVKLVFENSCPERVSGFLDPMRFQQIMLNLLSNACKFTPTGHIKVTMQPKLKKSKKFHRTSFDEKAQESISKRMHESFSERVRESFSERERASFSDSEMDIESESLIEEIPSERTDTHSHTNNEIKEIEISVEDTGIGIAKGNIKNLFQLFGKFEQVGNATGVGIGLAISQNLAKQMNLQPIKVKSQLGVGSRFWFSIKVLQNEHASISFPSSIFVKSSQSVDLKERNFVSIDKKLRKLRILVTDDDQINQMVIGEFLISMGNCLVEKAFNGKQALDLVIDSFSKQCFFDLILMDCNMPVMDGFEATEKIRRFLSTEASFSENPDRKLKIIALTANVSASDKSECLRRGMDEVWTKPLSKSDFIQKIRLALGLP
jgi:signal transduction histidine kinase/CheY-like chemotaxis protein